jgi:hypothetical protein
MTEERIPVCADLLRELIPTVHRYEKDRRITDKELEAVLSVFVTYFSAPQRRNSTKPRNSLIKRLCQLSINSA